MENNSSNKFNIKIKFLYFAQIKETLNKKFDIYEMEINQENNTNLSIKLKIEELLNIVKNINRLKSQYLDVVFTNCMISINDEYVGGSKDKDILVELKNNTEVSILPPISAG